MTRLLPKKVKKITFLAKHHHPLSTYCQIPLAYKTYNNSASIMQLEKFTYDNKIVRNFGIATLVWGIIGMTVGLLAAMQLFKPAMNMGSQYTTFGRIRPLHTNAVIFAFVGNAIFMGVYYSLQRLLKARMFSNYPSPGLYYLT
jgi:cbb3-type cytochrome oxidase subunit 1